ncbi:MAG: hypothetical protein AAFU79_21070 [Myxococcota bacterium]
MGDALGEGVDVVRVAPLDLPVGELVVLTAARPERVASALRITTFTLGG